MVIRVSKLFPAINMKILTDMIYSCTSWLMACQTFLRQNKFSLKSILRSAYLASYSLSDLTVVEGDPAYFDCSLSES